MKKNLLLLIFGICYLQQASAQHEHHIPEKKETTKPAQPKKTVQNKSPNLKYYEQSKAKQDSIPPEHPNHPNQDTIPGMNHMHNEDIMKMDHNHMDKPDTVPGSNMHHMVIDTVPKDHSMHDDMSPGTDMEMDMTPMSHVYSLNLPMNRNGSGTGWLPDASPMYGYMFHSKKWMYMLHGNLFIRYTNQDFSNKGSRGNNKIDAPSWFMIMGQHKVGLKGLFHFSTMFSLDPVIEGGSGYPLLFQSGETYKGKPLVDRQHPHDLFSELSVSYAYELSKKADLFIYIGYPGEPALGPVAFMHRPSSLQNPDAPLSHHWVDATHITFGVATVGFRYNKWKIEGSTFTGREPNENRYNFDRLQLNSFSGRISLNPSQNWAFQVSHGFIRSPEQLRSDENVRRTTASAIYSKAISTSSSFNSTVVWGINKSAGHNGENAFLLEGSLRKNKIAFYSRYEWVQKSTEELDLDKVTYGDHTLYPVNAFTIGINYDLLQIGGTRLAGGTQFTQYHAAEKLNSLYGKNPMAFEVFLRLYPNK